MKGVNYERNYSSDHLNLGEALRYPLQYVDLPTIRCLQYSGRVSAFLLLVLSTALSNGYSMIPDNVFEFVDDDNGEETLPPEGDFINYSNRNIVCSLKSIRIGIKTTSALDCTTFDFAETRDAEAEIVKRWKNVESMKALNPSHRISTEWIRVEVTLPNIVRVNDSKVTAEVCGFGEIFWWSGMKKEK
ncbi:unnamed protein product [Hymenolepis diminuta]|uniref:Neur_chan_LBD domain-containing protein n=1 Tax=Hymenolepis diminuta TaxID=6216 RepID=A0A0R3SMN5_HYMDI|nr:unnamed protein product [Hymenolepis diminuta]